jgi:acetyl-CoA acyltransferase
MNLTTGQENFPARHRDAVVVAAARTPVGRRRGVLAGVHPVDLSAIVLQALTERTGIEPSHVDDVIWGCVTQVGEQSGNVARLAALAAGWPDHIPGTTVDRACGSSQQAIHMAAAAVAAGHCDLVIAGGVESMTRVPMGSARRAGPGYPYGPAVRRRFRNQLGDDQEFSQGVAAERIAELWKLSRAELDSYALRSHAAAAAAADRGFFAEEIVPVTQAGTDGGDGAVRADEGIRRGGTLALLASLGTPFAPEGTVTAGNASQISDGAAGVVIATAARAAELGLLPVVRFRAFAVVGVDPVLMLTGPIPATARVLAKAGLSLGDIGVFEVNEAFSSVVLAWLKETGADPAVVNPNGGAIALGHPLGASGARLLTTMVHHMAERGIRYGLQTMCEGGGMANAMVVELT